MSKQASDTPISFVDREIYSCPFPAYDRLREEQPVYRDPKSGHYILTRYDDVRKALLNASALINNTGILGDKWKPEARRIFETEGWATVNTLVSNDAPHHRTYRTLVDKVFTTQKVLGLEPRIGQLIDGLIDRFDGAPEIDFVQAFAVPLPVCVIAEQLGVPTRDMEQFKHWSDLAIECVKPQMQPERELELAREIIKMQHYFADMIESVRDTPDDKLISRLVNLETEGRKLDMPELQSILAQILVGGNETTTNTLALGMKTLIERPDLAEAIYRDPDLARPFVEETLRVTAPLQTLFRKAVVDVVLGDVTVPAGSIIEVRYGAANRDPKQFACPAHFELDRKNSATHLAFGAGVHLCVGNQLARAELRLAFQALTRRLTNLRLSRGSESIQWVDSYVAYGPSKIWMAADARS